MEHLVKFGILACLVAAACGRAIGEEEEECNCESRFYQHYASKGCDVSQTDSCGCPTSYACPSKNESFAPSKGCVYQNVEYAVGHRIVLNDRCQACRCANAADPRIVCRPRECPQLEFVEGDNCHPVFEKTKCCPSRYECVVEDADNDVEKTAPFTCAHENVTYPLGARIYSSEDPCRFCDCDEQWNGVENSTCQVQECVFERSQHYLDAGCIPVYHESKCCPIEYYCPEGRTIVAVAEENGTQTDTVALNENDAGWCVFGGIPYRVGEELPLNNTCVRCICRVPPDVTCIHQSCPPSPNAENCYEFYTADQCCPVYDCAQGDDPGDSGEAGVDGEDQVICPTPMCADSSCVIGVLEGEECPTCICDDSREVNELESVDATEESPYMGVEEGPEGTKEPQGGDSEFPEGLVPKVLDEGLLEKPGGEVGSEEDREIFSEPFFERVLDKEEDALENIVKEETGQREPKTAFQKYEIVDEALRNVWETNSSDGEGPEVPKIPNEIRRKRSTNSQYGYQHSAQQGQWSVLQQDSGALDSSESSERELESAREDGNGYSEVKVFSSRETSYHRPSADMLTLGEDEYKNVIWRTTVPGCPAPMCADSTCRIGVPPGRRCPTCICKKRRQP